MLERCRIAASFNIISATIRPKFRRVSNEAEVGRRRLIPPPLGSSPVLMTQSTTKGEVVGDEWLATLDTRLGQYANGVRGTTRNEPPRKKRRVLGKKCEDAVFLNISVFPPQDSLT